MTFSYLRTVACRRKSTGCPTNTLTNPTLGETVVTHDPSLSSISTMFSLEVLKLFLLMHGCLGGSIVESIFRYLYIFRIMCSKCKSELSNCSWALVKIFGG